MSSKTAGDTFREGMSRFLSRRGKRSTGDKRKSLNNVEEPPPVVPSDLYNIFSIEDDKKLDKEEEKKVKLIAQRLQNYGITALKEPQIAYALRSKITNGDVKETFELLVLFEDSLEGILRDYNPKLKLLGAENRNAVTCYLDSLLFAMFARLDCFEAMLFDSFTDEPRRRLATILRLWVNMLRAGKLVTTDITKHLQEALSKCGWQEAAQLVQQDASEAFTFITGQLELPLLTLKMDIYHTGKEDVADDHRFVNERLLEVAIPEENPQAEEPIKLEECLEVYFNNRIEVRRHLERRATTQSLRDGSKDEKSDKTDKPSAVHVETAEVSGAESPSTAAPTYSTDPNHPELPAHPINQRTRTDSIFSERHVEEGEPSFRRTESHGRPRAGSLKKEITMPAWQFFSLIPWYTDNAPANDAQVAAHFAAKRPILGICLKRYSMTPNGQPVRRGTYIDIPLEIALPHFISDDRLHEEGPLFGNFQLVLQSVVCHRGVSVDSGHYISLVRGREASVAHDINSTIDDESPWMRFDDLAKDRVSHVDIHQALKEETPYLLFYQVCPIDEELARGAPPTYEEANSEATTADDAFMNEKGDLVIDTSDWETSRPSFEASEGLTLGTSQELSGADDNGPRGRSSFNSTSRNSIVIDETSLSRGPTGPSTPADESKPSFLSSSRRSSKAKKNGSKSRPSSQSGEGRLSITMSRLTGRKSRDKLPLDVAVSNSISNSGAASFDEPHTPRNQEFARLDENVIEDPSNPRVTVEAPPASPALSATPGTPEVRKSSTVVGAMSMGRWKTSRSRRSSSVPLGGEEGTSRSREDKGKEPDGEMMSGSKKKKKQPPERECAVM
ncbi:ubiquitin C-terminal hydrolase family protein [Phyllosticta capitalensis]|uniref:ubiquitinyl hydrolase 1 n=1 Tax=Phyllosticta capitalensis TaxID=121624 RepID=A0ABR1Z2B3_9PEZI